MDRLIPPPDAFGLPAPWWLLLVLLDLTFLIHLVFMNFVLGGAVLQAAALCWPRRNEAVERLVRLIASMWPVAFSFTITSGVAPLLFVQVLYGQFFYTSTILIGAAWLAILIFLLLAFYLAYALQAMLKKQLWPPAWRAALATLIALCVLSVAYILTANAVLMTEPGRWWAVHSGAQSGLTPWHSTLLPRFVHNVVSAGVVTGLWIIWAACLRRDVVGPIRDELVRLGMRIGAWSAALSSAIGIWYFFAMEHGAQRSIHSYVQWYGIGWLTGVTFAVLAMVVMFRGARRPAERRWTKRATLLTIFALAGMVMGREGLRIAALSRPVDAGAPAFEYTRFATYTQTSPILVFIPLLLGGIAAVAMMLWWYRSGPTRTTAAP